MDSINLSETQSTPLNWRNTASNTNPISCACCGSKDYTQTISQANYYRSLNPWMPKCKHSQDGCEDNCTIPPFFPSFPFLQPFFHNSTMPGYACCSRYHLDDSVVNLKQATEQNQAKSKNEKKVSLSGDGVYDEKIKHDSDENNTSLNENARKNVGALGADPQLSGHPFFFSNLMDPRLSAFQRCACDDSTPWTCSPFIIPIVSYCLFWNSQKHNIFFSNYPGIQSEMMLQQQNMGSPRHPSSAEANPQNFKIINKPEADNSLLNKNGAFENCLGVDRLSEKEWKPNDENSFHSVNSHMFGECCSLSSTEKKESPNFKNAWGSICTEKEAMDAESFIVDNQAERDDFLNMDIKSSFHSKSHPSLDLDDDNLKENNSKAQLTPQLEVSDGFKSCDEEKIDSKSDEEDCLFLKKSYLNIPDQNRIVFEETRAVEVAGGDAGGEHCMGYRVPMSPPHDQEVNIRQEIPNETNLGTIESQLIKGLVELKEKKIDSLNEKTAITNVKNPRFKTGIVKNVIMSSPRETKGNHEPSLEEPIVMKRKHACFPSVDNGMGQTENKSKIQKIKNHTVIKQQDLGSGKLQKAFNNKAQFYKRDEKISTLKAPPHGMQMQTSDIVRSRRK